MSPNVNYTQSQCVVFSLCTSPVNVATDDLCYQMVGYLGDPWQCLRITLLLGNSWRIRLDMPLLD